MENWKVFSVSEISSHSSKDDCWVLIDDKVYDVTKFLEEHPGGEDVLIEGSANGDASKAFEEVGHSSTATSMMTAYLIGFKEGSVFSNDMGTQNSNVGKQKEHDVVAAKKTQTIPKKPSLTSRAVTIFEYLVIIVLAFGAWYFLISKAKA